MRRHLLRIMSGLVIAATVWIPAAAWAAPHGRIVDVGTVNGRLRILFSASGLPDGVSLDPRSVDVNVEGTHVNSVATTAGTQPQQQQIDRSALLIIDTSGSMAGQGIAGAKAAATTFVDSVPSDVKVGLIAFSATPHVLVAPTTNRAQIKSSIQSLKASGETALYDAVGLGLKTLGSTGLRNIVLLTDGADTRSKTKLAELLPEVQSSKVTIDAVGFRTTDAQSAPLKQIAANGGGQVIAATAASDLATAFRSAAQDISHQLVIVASVPPQFANGQHTINVSVKAGGATLSDSAFAPIGDVHVTPQSASPAQYGAQPAPTHKGLPKSALWVALLALFVGVAVLLGVALSGLAKREKGTGVRRRLSIYTLTGRPVEETREETNSVLGDSAVARSAVEFAGRVVKSRDLESVLGRRLDAAGVPMKAPEWLILHTGIAVVGGLLLLLISSGGVLATVLGLGAGLFLPWAYLLYKEGKRTSAFLERMPDTLQLMAGGLRAGYSLPQSVDAAVREGSEPISSEFNRALVETRLGVSIEDALEGVATRMKSVDFDWVVMAIRIQREVGGNLAEVLTTVAATLRERERLRRQVRVLSAEGRLSAWILGSLPALFFLYLLLVRHDYIQTLWKDPIGIVMIVFLFIDLIVGVLWLRKVIRVEV